MFAPMNCAVDGSDLPAVTLVRNLALPVILRMAMPLCVITRLLQHDRRDIYEVAVLQQAQGKGGSQFIA